MIFFFHLHTILIRVVLRPAKFYKIPGIMCSRIYAECVRHSTSANRSATWLVSLLYTMCHVLNIAAYTINTWFFSETRSGKNPGCFRVIKSAIILLYTVLLFFDSMCQTLDQEHKCDLSLFIDDNIFQCLCVNNTNRL